MIKETEHLTPNMLAMTPKGGTVLCLCEIDAVLLSCQHQIDVAFKYDGNTYTVKWVDILTCVKQTDEGTPF